MKRISVYRRLRCLALVLLCLLLTACGKKTEAQTAPGEADAAQTALVIGGQTWAGCDAADLTAAWSAWQSMTPDERARWRG